ncbi:hypothetical protein KSP39_PZI022001 [Platanthera zijinensis]|uniref:Transmembrane protein n=1 Tax=Platanthera zijinensis TaxID=2320716 RepID=A0AAP0AX42_9ASPA
MANASNIIRSSIHTFFCNYNTFVSLAVLLIFPASAVTLLSSSFIPSSSSSSSSSNFLLAVPHRLHSLFEAANFPSNSRLFTILTLKLSQTILCFLFTLPFTLTFLNLSKTYIIFSTCKPPLQRQDLPPFSSILHLYLPLLLTHLYTILVILSTNCAVFSAFLALDVLGLLSATSLLTITGAGAILYSIILGNVLVISNLAGIISAKENAVDTARC